MTWRSARENEKENQIIVSAFNQPLDVCRRKNLRLADGFFPMYRT
jgi:hypothetical protein